MKKRSQIQKFISLIKRRDFITQSQFEYERNKYGVSKEMANKLIILLTKKEDGYEWGDLGETNDIMDIIKDIHHEEIVAANNKQVWSEKDMLTIMRIKSVEQAAKIIGRTKLSVSSKKHEIRHSGKYELTYNSDGIVQSIKLIDGKTEIADKAEIIKINGNGSEPKYLTEKDFILIIIHKNDPKKAAEIVGKTIEEVEYILDRLYHDEKTAYLKNNNGDVIRSISLAKLPEELKKIKRENKEKAERGSHKQRCIELIDKYLIIDDDYRASARQIMDELSEFEEIDINIQEFGRILSKSGAKIEGTIPILYKIRVRKSMNIPVDELPTGGKLYDKKDDIKITEPKCKDSENHANTHSDIKATNVKVYEALATINIPDGEDFINCKKGGIIVIIDGIVHAKCNGNYTKISTNYKFIENNESIFTER